MCYSRSISDLNLKKFGRVFQVEIRDGMSAESHACTSHDIFSLTYLTPFLQLHCHVEAETFLLCFFRRIQENAFCVVSQEMLNLLAQVASFLVVWMSGFMSIVDFGLQKCLKMMKAVYRMFKLRCQEENKW